MKKKGLYTIYVIFMFAVCLIPFVATFIHSEDNQREAGMESPKIKTKGKININYLQNVDDYFSKKFAFRNDLIEADGKVMRNIFSQSNNDKLVVGKDGWIFFADTLDDYKGICTITNRGANNIARTIELMQKAMESEGRDFVFTIAPNKNSLYGKYMPNNIRKISDCNNYNLVKDVMINYKINYFDLFDFLRDKDEIMYCKTDSHWNNKGAAITTTALLKELNKEVTDYSQLAPKKKFDYTGDLWEMLFPNDKKPSESNFYYGNEENIQFTSPLKSVDAVSITTANQDKEDSIMMFRDSFGNAIIPYIADEYNKCTFSKAVPYNLSLASLKNVDDVVVEIVERNLDTICNQIPVINMPTNSELEIVKAMEDLDADIKVSEKEEQYLVTGHINPEFVNDNTLIYVIINEEIYEAFPCSNNNQYDDYAFGGYIPNTEDINQMKVAVLTDGILHMTEDKK